MIQNIQYVLGALYDAQIKCEVFGILALNFEYHLWFFGAISTVQTIWF